MNDRKDYLWAIIASTLILLWGSIPTWAGYKAETQDLRFRGIYYDSQDYAVHVSMMEAGRQGEAGYQFRFTTELHDPAYLRLFYIALGHVSRLVGLPAETTFHLTRWLLGYMALFCLYKLARQIFFDLFWSRTAFLLATLGSGLGWLQLIFDWAPGPITPIDFWQIDSHVFFSLSLFPHFAFVTAGMCILFIFWLEYLEKPRWQPILWMAITGTMVQLVNPIALATVDAGLAGAMFMGWWKDRRIRWQDFHTIGLVAIVQSPLLAYNYWVLNNDPIWSQFTVQNRTPSPPLEYYLWGFAPFLPFAIIGTIDLLRNRSRASAASLFWIITGFALAYAPLLIQRRFLQNITIPLAILAVQGLMRLFGMSSAQSPFMKRWRSGLVFLFVFVASLSSIQLSLGRALYLQTHPEDLYYPSSLDDAVEWFRDHAQYNDFVLGAEKTSQVLAQKAGLRAYFGHEMETLDYEGKKEQVNSFFAGSADGLASPPIQWVVYGPYEQATNPAFQPPTNLELVFDVRNLKIYKVK